MKKTLKTIMLLALILLLPLSVFSDEVCNEWTFDFEEPSGNPEHVSGGWYQNKSGNFKPFGVVEILDAPFATSKKAVKLSSTEKSTDVVTRTMIPVQAGDTLQLTILFRSANGTDNARVGLYGYNDKGGLNDYQAVEFLALNTEWDLRQTCFEINDHSVTKVSFFVAAKANQSMIYSFLRVKKLSSEEAFLITPKNAAGLWYQRSKGNNLALKQKVTFIPEPNYELTRKGGTDLTDLTDGKLARSNGSLWFEKEAVAWYRALNGVTIIADLGSVQPVRKGVIRVCGGTLDGITFPIILEAWVSKDGKIFHLAASMKKVAESEKEMINWKDLYYLPETNDKPVYYIYPFELNIDADARYVAFRAPIYTSTMMVSDELAVMQASKEETQVPAWNAVYQKQGETLIHSSITIRPRMDQFYIARNMKLPNWLQLDCRLPESTGRFRYEIEMPENVVFTPEYSWPQFTRTLTASRHDNGRVTYVFEPGIAFETFLRVVKDYRLGPFFFSTDGMEKRTDQNDAVFTTFYNGQKEMSRRVPIEYIDIPEVPPLQHLNVSLAWTENRHMISYPDFLKNQKKLGFTEISLFGLSKDAPQMKELAVQAVQEGYRIRMQMSPSAHLNSLYRNVTEYKCSSCHDIRSICPAYRGKYYLELLQNIENAVRDYPVHAITFDEETWGTVHLNKSINCHHCMELRKQKNMDWKPYFEWTQAEFYAGFKEAVARGAAAGNKKMPKIGYYALSPTEMKRCAFGNIHFLAYPKMFPENSDEVQDSYYGRDTKTAHDRARAIYRIIGKPAVINTWITGGSGAHCETAYPKRTGQHLIETLMNGAGGVQYFMYPSFESPLDYYYHALAMKQIAPFENILMKGTLDETLTGNSTILLYTARTLGRQTLLLIGNYASVREETTEIDVRGAKTVTDQINEKKLTSENGKTTITVPADSYALILIEK